MKTASMTMLAGFALIAGALWAAWAGVGVEPGAEARFQAFDRNGDGVVSKTEADAASAGLHTHFDKFDRNNDGVLSVGEFRGQTEPRRQAP